MGLPQIEDNADGYERGRLSTKYTGFRNKTYLLVHGSLDDNVHYQQSMALSRSLEVNDIPFEQIVSGLVFGNQTNKSIMLLHCSLIIFLFVSISVHRLIQMKIIHCGVYDDIYIMHSIDILRNV